MCLMEHTMTEEEIRAALLKALSEFDWYYEFSDDFSHWSRMNGKLRAIHELAKQLPDGMEMVNSVRPTIKI